MGQPPIRLLEKELPGFILNDMHETSAEPYVRSLFLIDALEDHKTVKPYKCLYPMQTSSSDEPAQWAAHRRSRQSA